MRRILFAAAAAAGVLAWSPTLAQAPATVQERVAALKQSLAASQQALRSYQWVETTTVSLKGEAKSQKQASCYYGADGTLQKVPMSATPPPKKKGGLRGAIVEKKKEEIAGAAQKAVALVKTYVPPNPALIQKAVESGNANLEIVEPGKVGRLVFKNYELPGDSMAITIDLATNRLMGLDVATYLEAPSKPVTLKVTMGSLADGSTYTARTDVAIPSEQLVLDVANTGYRKM